MRRIDDPGFRSTSFAKEIRPLRKENSMLRSMISDLNRLGVKWEERVDVQCQFIRNLRVELRYWRQPGRLDRGDPVLPYTY